MQFFFYTPHVQPFLVSLFQPRIPLYAPLKSWSLTQSSQSLFGRGISLLPAAQYPEQGPNLLLELTSSRPLGSCKSHHRDFMIFLAFFFILFWKPQCLRLSDYGSFTSQWKRKPQKLQMQEINKNLNFSSWRGFNLIISETSPWFFQKHKSRLLNA